MEFSVVDWLAPSKLRWPGPDGPWTITLTWRELRGRVECVGLELVSDHGTQETVSATLLRSVPVARLIQAARRQRFSEAGGDFIESDEGQSISRSQFEELKAVSTSWTEPKRVRLRQYDLAHYRDVAQIYSAALGRGDPPLIAVQKHFTTSRPTASRWVAAAREEGLLPGVTRGQALGNGQLTQQIQEKT